MRRAYYELYAHIVWSTKYKEAMLKNDMEHNMYQIVEEKCKKFKANIIAKGNTEDHIHLLLSITPDTAISMLIKEIKGATSYFINRNTDYNLYWQDSYGVLSVSKSGVEAVSKYIQNQKVHHKSTDNLIASLEKDYC